MASSLLLYGLTAYLLREDAAAALGKIKLDKPGVVQVELRAETKPPKDWGGLCLASARLIPVKK